MKVKGSLILVLSQDVIFKPFFLYRLLEILKKNNLKVSKIIEVSTKENKFNLDKKNPNVWSFISYCQFITIFLFKKFTSALPIIYLLKWKSTVKLVSKKYKVKYEFIEDLNNFLSKQNFYRNDIVFSFQHQIIKNPDKYNCTLINCHPGDLSSYRGIKPIFWTMLDKKNKGFISIHLIDSGIDTGGIVLEKGFSLEESLADNYFNAYKLSPYLVLDAIKVIIKNNNNKSIFKKKLIKSNSYRNQPNIIDIKKFRRLNYKTRLSLKNFIELLKIF